MLLTLVHVASFDSVEIGQSTVDASLSSFSTVFCLCVSVAENERGGAARTQRGCDRTYATPCAATRTDAGTILNSLSQGAGLLRCRRPTGSPPHHVSPHRALREWTEQDESLDELSAAIARMKSLGEAIGSELDTHNAIIDDIQSGTVKADVEVTKAAAAAVDAKDSAGTGCAVS